MVAFSLSSSGREIDLAGIQTDLLFAETQMDKTVTRLGSFSSFPRSTGETGLWSTRSASDWTSGFFPGELWLLYQATGNTKWRDAAESWTASLASQATRTDTHDVGFMIGSSFGNGYRLTGNPSYQAVIQQAATSLASRYDPDAEAIRSWSFGPWSYPVIIDNMMNLTPLLWGAGHGGNLTWTDMAITHANTTIANIVRPDGSTFQLADFNPDTGALIEQETYQGYSDSSTWARGQAWAIHGFTEIYGATKAPAFLAAAQSTANYFLSHLPSDFVPYWDFNAPVTPTTPRDTSAAAITASALTKLSTLVETPADQQTYLTNALKILGSLSTTTYLAPSSSEAILRHATGGATFEVDTSLIYGDYYFTEALLRAQTVLRGEPLWTQYDPPVPANNLVVSVAEDAYQGDAQFTISVDGAQVGGVLTATALRSAGQSQAFTVSTTLSPGTHTVGVTFINDAWGGTPSTDRNLFVTGLTLGGRSVPGSTATLMSNGTAAFAVSVPGQSLPGPGTGQVIGRGPDTLVLRLQQDAYQGDALYTVSIDGTQVGGTLTASATRASGQFDTLTVLTDLAPGGHTVAVSFLNDAYGGSANTDRNLFINSGTYNGDTIAFTTKELLSSGTAFISFSEAGTVPPATIGRGPDTLVLRLQQDAYQGDALYTVSVDGVQVGGTLTASATRASGQFDTLTVLADLASGGHTVAVSFLNDAYGGSASTDRNLHLSTITYNGASVPNAEASLFDARSVSFGFTDIG